MQTLSQARFTRTELLVATAVVVTVAVIAVPGLLRARMSGNEAAAIASLRAIADAELAYASVCGHNYYAPALSTLGVPPQGGSQAFLESGLAVAAPQRGGYRYTLAAGEGAAAGPSDCNGTATTTAYYATAVPARFGGTGGRSFAVNTARTIWQAPAAAAPVEPFAAPATPIQ